MKLKQKLLSSATGLLIAGSASAAVLEVEMTGFSDDHGMARVVVMAGAAGYAGTIPVYRTAQVPITDGTAVWRADDIAPGAYAVIAHHDRDGDDALNRPVLGLPLEPYGYSRGAWTSFGLPDWARVSFRVGAAPTHQHIHMRMNVFAVFGQILAVGAPSLALIFAGLTLVRRRRNHAPAGDPANKEART